MQEILGILGGMGPLASAEFLKTLYEFNLPEKEQDAPRCILHSDPSIPDRTEAILKKDTAELLGHISKGLDKLRLQGATHFVIACVTSHCLIPRLSPEHRKDIISLIDIALTEVETFPGRALLMATTGTMKSCCFQRHAQWRKVRHKLVLPDPEDQRSIHRFIYSHIKPNRDVRGEALLEYLKRRYQVDAFLAGCTEFHLVNKQLLSTGNSGIRFIDPLFSIGRELPRLMRRAPQTVS